MKKIIIPFILLISNSLLAQKAIKVDKNVSASYIPPNIITKNQDFEASTGAFFFDATKRMGKFAILKNKDGSFTTKYLGEEQPDAIYETIKDFLAEATVNVKDKIIIDTSVDNLVKHLVEKLTNKSNALNFLRTSLYRLNESFYNGNVGKAEYADLFKIIINSAQQIEMMELKIEQNKSAQKTEKETINSQKNN